MDNEKLKEKVLSIVPNAEIVEGKQYLTITVIPGKIFELAKHLKEDPETQFDYLFCQTGVDYGEKLGVVYHLESIKYRHSIELIVLIANRETPRLTVCTIYGRQPNTMKGKYSIFWAYHSGTTLTLEDFSLMNHGDIL